MTRDTEMRKLCNELFDALEVGDVDTVARLYDDDLAFWFNVTGQTMGKEANLEALTSGKEVQRRRTYNDRLISTWDDGFLVQYSLNVVLHNGAKVTLWACLVAEARDGKILKMWEYLDSSKFVLPPKKKPVAAEGAA